jgi:hypothetical protein
MRHATLSVCICLGLSLPAAADINEARRLANDGQTEQALEHVAELVRAQPDDIPVRLLRGVLLSSSGQSDAAIDVFLDIAEDRPDLPEPHNNLAVLYAAQGRYDEARSALSHAIKLQPDYDVAHENLGDVYLKLAFLSFSNAERINPNNANAANKVAATDQFLNASQSQRSNPPATREIVTSSAQPAASVPSARPADAPAEGVQPTHSAIAGALAAPIQQCVEFPTISPVSRAQRIERWLTAHGMQTSSSKSPADSSAGLAYRVLLRAGEDAAPARERIAQLRAKDVTDLIIIARGEHANGISLGVFAKRSGAQRRQAALAEKDVHAQIVEHRTSAARDVVTIKAIGPFDVTAFNREFAKTNYQISQDTNECR